VASDEELPDGLGGDDEEHRRIAEEMHARWLAGEAKSQLEIAYWSDGTDSAP
jgi:hypothetical protein